MARITQIVGLILVVVGVIVYLATDRESWTALFPAILGLIFLALGVLAARAESGKHFVHAAMVVALLGAAGTMSRTVELTDGVGVASVASAVTWVACVVLLVRGVRSFVEARRSS